MIKKLLAICLLLITSGVSKNPPNFVIIFLDDQGYNDLGVFGSPLIKTPKIDQIAAEGGKYTDFYSANSVCTPSRAGILTGSYPRRVGNLSVLFPRHDIGLDPNEITIADMMKRRGYMTAAIGKWHLGDLDKFLPTNNGFDSYYGIPYSNDMEIAATMKLSANIVLREGYTLQSLNALLAQPQGDIRSQTIGKVPLLRNNEVIEYPVDQSTVSRRYTDEALKFIGQNAQDHRPFFLFLAHTMPHIPLYASPQFLGTSARGLYGDVIEEIDFNVGRITDTLKTLGIDSNTLLIYTSDNGPWNLSNGRGGSADPLRGFKFATWEGGQRVPTVMKWPGQIPAGLVQNAIGASIDFFPTLVALSGGTLPTGETIRSEPWIIDGNDIIDIIKGVPNADRGEPYFYQQANNANFQAVRDGDFKLRLGALYDLSNDIHEDTDLSNSNTAKANELQTLLDNFISDINANARPRGEANTVDPVKGCTNPDASNYDQNARQDDNSCTIVRGCTEPTARNYNSSAVQDDGSCDFTSIEASLKNKGIHSITNAGEFLTVQLLKPGQVQIYNINGIVIYRSSGNKKISHVISKEEFVSGTYFLRMVSSELVSRTKINIL